MKVQPKKSFSSFLQEQNIPQIRQKKQSQQIKALFLKNVRLQSKQVGTNICQILTPIICIIFAYLIKEMASESMTIGVAFLPNYYPYNFNEYSIVDSKNKIGTRNPLNWFLVECVQNCNSTFLGQKDGLNNGTPSGLLGSVPNNFITPVEFRPIPYQNNSKIQSRQVPFFQFTENQNKTINSQLYQRLQIIVKQDFEILNKKGGRDYLPDGAMTFYQLNQNKVKATVSTLDARQLEFYRPNGYSRIRDLRNTTLGVPATFTEFTPAVGMLSIVDLISSTYIKNKASVNVNSGYIYMPDLQQGGTFIDTIINIVSALVFPLALSLLFPVFLYSIVLQKQQKLIQMMKMNGMKISSYWLVYFLFNFTLGLITNVIFFLFGYFILKSSFFTQTSFVLLALTFIGWILAQIGLAVFFQTFLNKSRSANIVGYLICIWTMMIGSTLNIGVYQFPTTLPIILQMFPPFGFIRLCYLMLTVCSDSTCYTTINAISQQMKVQLAFLYLGAFFFFILGAYLFEVIPQEFGVTRSPFFPFIQLFKCFSSIASKKNSKHHNQIKQDQKLRDYIKYNQQDDLARKQRDQVYKTEGDLEQYPLVINNLRKIYRKQGHKGDFLAVKSFNLKVKSRQVFGLLGPNGAGKTTLISMITGMFKPNDGNAWIGGYDILNNVADAQLQMGVCPQFDLLWPQLTVEQHLYFYARLKGVPSKSIKQKVKNAINQVKLQKFHNFKSSSLSGGMKRRLSVAISLVGDPLIVFLDQPSTGLDPDNRRQLWQVLSRCSKKRSIFLTTHMMQEADTLCNRVGIITNGILRTVAPQVTLKKTYGGGYRVTMSVLKQEKVLIQSQNLKMKHINGGNQLEQYQDEGQDSQNNIRKSVNSFIEVQQAENKIKIAKRNESLRMNIERLFPGSSLSKLFAGSIIFKIPLKYKVSQLFEIFEKKQKELDIADVAITNSSLQDVFMNVVLIFQQGKKDLLQGIISQASSKKQFSNKNSLMQKQKEENQQQINQKSSDQFKSFPVDNNKPPQDKYGSVVSKKRESVLSQQQSPTNKKQMNKQKQEQEEPNKRDDDSDYDD